MKNKKLKGIIALIGVTALITGLVACGNRKEETEQDNSQSQIEESVDNSENSIVSNKLEDESINDKKDTVENSEATRTDIKDLFTKIDEVRSGEKVTINDITSKDEIKKNDNKKEDTNKPVVIKPVVVEKPSKPIENQIEKPVIKPNKPIEKPVEKPVEKPNKPHEEDKVIATAYVNVDVLNVRSGVGVEHDIIGTLKEGTKVEIVKIGDGWNKIKFNGSYGYVASKYLSEKPVEKPNKPENKPEDNNKPDNKPENKPETKPEEDKVIGIAYVTSETLDVKESEKEDSKTLGTLKYGDKVEVLGQNGLWYKIKYNGGHGYVYSNLTDEDINNIKYEYMSELSQETFKAINEFRKANGVAELKFSQECTDIAKKQAEENAKNVTAEHDFDEIALYNHVGTTESFINQWANSPIHKKDLLDTNSTMAGVGVYKDSTGRYFVVCRFGSDN